MHVCDFEWGVRFNSGDLPLGQALWPWASLGYIWAEDTFLATLGPGEAHIISKFLEGLVSPARFSRRIKGAVSCMCVHLCGECCVNAGDLLLGQVLWLWASLGHV